MFLDVFVESIYGKQRQAGKDCLRNYRKHAAELQRHVGRRLRLSDLSQPLVSRWLLDEAVSAYESGVVSDCLSALRECRAMEIEGGGDSPATDGLAGQLLEEWEDVAEEDEDEE